MTMAMAMIPRTRTKLIPILAALALVPFLLYINLDGWGFDDDDNDAQRILEPWVPSQGRQLESTTPMAPRGKVVALTSWYTFNRDPQRAKVLVSSELIAYINNLYTTATHFGVPLVVFHDALTEEFVAKYTNEYVSFQHAVPDRSMSTNDFRFIPYLEYVKEHDLDTVLMVDASDVWFNSDPFSYIQEHEGPQDQLFMSYENSDFQHSSWMVPRCYGDAALSWPKGLQMYNAGVWGGKGPAIQCVLECVNEQLDGPLRGHGNCNMPAVNYCVHFGKCQSESAPIVHKNPTFVNPFGKQCTDSFSVVHNKCPKTWSLITINIVNDEVVMDIREKTEKEIEAEKAERKRGLRNRARRAAERKRAELQGNRKGMIKVQ